MRKQPLDRHSESRLASSLPPLPPEADCYAVDLEARGSPASTAGSQTESWLGEEQRMPDVEDARAELVRRGSRRTGRGRSSTSGGGPGSRPAPCERRCLRSVRSR